MAENTKLPPLLCSQGGFAFNREHIEHWRRRAETAESLLRRAPSRNSIIEECAKVADGLAEEQEATNAKYPDHVKAYPAWEAYALKFRQVARAIRALKHMEN